MVRGDDTDTSDLDIVVIDPDSGHCRRSYKYQGWPVEVFLYSLDSLAFYFEIEVQRGVPLLIRLCAEGRVVKGESKAEFTVRTAGSLLQKGPHPLTRKEIDEARYRITDLVCDLEGSGNVNEDLFTVNDLTSQLHQFVLRTNQRWVGIGKWAYRSLADFDVRLADRLTDCLRQFYQFNEKGAVIRFVDEILEPYGGRFFGQFTD